jgi:hypothetical protein
MRVCTFCGDSARAERMTTECVPSYGGAHEALGSSERLESTLPGKLSSCLRPGIQHNPPALFIHIPPTSHIYII